MRRLSLRVAVALAVVAVLVSCRAGSMPSQRTPIVVLISIDGFRWDYLDRLQPPTLLRLATDGVRADGLIPQFPSKTFPNHYTLVTGLRLAHHGIISNNMAAPDVPGRFSLRNRDILADSRWWGGEPIWNTAERQGHITSAMFWPGSEAAIGGRRPTYWLPYDESMPHAARVEQTLAWMTAPAGQSASFLTLYFSDVDSAGHSRGPESPEVRDAVAKVDAAIAQLVRGVAAAGLTDRVHYIIVSDHGMAPLAADRIILLDSLVDVDTVDVIDWSPVLGLSPRHGSVEALYARLKDRHPALAVYRSAELPARYRLAGHPRLPPIVGIAAEGWHIASTRDTDRWQLGDGHAPGGNHGYDPEFRSMHGLFIARGPQLQSGLRVPAFENIHVYELMCALLRVTPAPNDGDPAVTAAMRR